MGKIVVIEGSHCSGKSTTINEICRRLNFWESKSVPDWFRKFIPFARSKKAEEQFTIYEIGHLASFYDAKKSENNYVFDRWIATTFIRLNFDCGISVDDTVKSILDYQLMPDLTIMLKATPETIIERRIKRDGDNSFDNNFFRYENKVFYELSKHDGFVLIDNDRSINDTMEEIEQIMKSYDIIDSDIIKRRIK